MDLFVVNTVRRQHTRARRRATPGRLRFTQRILGGKLRLVRNRAARLPLELFEAHRVELQRLQEAGALEVRIGGPKGRVYDFGGEDVPRKEKDAPAPVDASPESSEPGESEEEGGEGEDLLEDEEPEEVEDDLEEGEAPDMSWTKAQLVEYAADALGEDHDDLDRLTKAQILEKL